MRYSVLPLLLLLSSLLNAQTITVSSSENITALLELYTSEGCSSCPPADDFLSHLEDNGYDPGSVIPLAFHVDYWDYIGWKDKFSDPEYTKRQKRHQIMGNLPTMYTPQLVLNAKDLRPVRKLSKRLESINLSKAAVGITLQLDFGDNSNEWPLRILTNYEDSNSKPMLYVALAESNLSSSITAGENSGRTLHHDHVVRKLYGPYVLDGEKKSTTHILIQSEPHWKRDDMAIIGFVQTSRGDILQAVRLSF